MLCRICIWIAQIQPRKHVLDDAGYCTAPTRQHELDHTEHTDHTDHTDHTNHIQTIQIYRSYRSYRSCRPCISYRSHTDHIQIIQIIQITYRSYTSYRSCRSYRSYRSHTDHTDHTYHIQIIQIMCPRGVQCLRFTAGMARRIPRRWARSSVRRRTLQGGGSQELEASYDCCAVFLT